MKLIRMFQLTIVALSLITFISNGISYAQEDDNGSIKLYVLDTCPHCQTLLQEITPLGIIEQLGVVQIEVSMEAEKELLIADLQVCNDDDLIVPTLVVDGLCYQGRSDVTKILYEEAGITRSEDSEEDPPPVAESQTEDSTELENEITGESPEPERLSDRLAEDRTEPRELPEVTLWQILIIIISICSFVYLGNIMIKRLKL